MELVVITIMLLVGFSFLLKLSFEPVLGRLAVCLILALFVGLSWEYAAGQSKTEIAGWLENPELMLDIAVLLTVDVFMQISFCVLSAKQFSTEKLSRAEKVIKAVVLWIPGLLIFPALFALLVEVIFSFPGSSFSTLAWCTAAAVFIGSPALSWLLGQALPEKELRLELMFMVNALIALLGVIATVNGRTAVKGTNTVEWLPLASVIAILTVGAIAGAILYKRKNNKIISRIQ